MLKWLKDKLAMIDNDPVGFVLIVACVIALAGCVNIFVGALG